MKGDGRVAAMDTEKEEDEMGTGEGQEYVPTEALPSSFTWAQDWTPLVPMIPEPFI